jgi:hypothetical protein
MPQKPSNPRRNTSKEFFEVLPRGNSVEICFLFASYSFPLYFRFPSFLAARWKYCENILPLCFHFTNFTSSTEARLTMPGKPHRSILIPYETEIATLRRHKSIEMTMRYAHLFPEHKKSAVDALEVTLTPKAEKAEKRA